MKILLVGGGSGGHVTPLKSVLEALPVTAKGYTVTVITDRKFFPQTQHIFKDHPGVRIRKIFAGKYRRYHGKSTLWHLTHLPTVAKNLRDLFFLFIGSLQSLVLLGLRRPDVVFSKGGFVSVPVGLAARILKIPLVIHDSDTRPGLSSRIISRWASKIATGMPTEFYPYPKAKMVYTGMPASSGVSPVNSKQVAELKKQLGMSSSRPLLLVTGGSTGAKVLNECFSKNAALFIQKGWQIVQSTGIGKSAPVVKKQQALAKKLRQFWRVEEFIDMVPYVNAADLILSRAGATAMQEFANAKKPVVIVPSPYLSDQVKNAEMFAQYEAAYYLTEAELQAKPELLFETIHGFGAFDGKIMKQMASKLHSRFAKPRAAHELAQIIVSQAKRH